MEKVVILTSQCQSYIDLVIRVANWDEKCADVIEAAMQHWHGSDSEFRDVVEKHLSEAGYTYEIVDDYIIIDDPAG